MKYIKYAAEIGMVALCLVGILPIELPEWFHGIYVYLLVITGLLVVIFAAIDLIKIRKEKQLKQ